ncbi:MAG: type II secretion system F family protein [Verrucomicrobia bacterium]|nr:type II secretion system F family protein [Verrucomicrobiota bacterium]
MPEFTYKARKASGELDAGVVEASDRAAAAAKLRAEGLFPLALTAARGGVPETVSRETGASVSERPRRRRKPRLQELATFTQQLANLLRAGMPLTMALQSMSQIGSRGVPPEVSRRLRQDVMEGRSLSEAMARQPWIFSELYVNMVRAGEQSGALTEVLQRLADHYTRFAEVRHRVLSAMIYPAVVSAVGIGIVIFFMTGMLPRFMTIFEGMNVPLPATTRLLIQISHFVGRFWWLLLGAAAVGGVLLRRWASTEQGRRSVDALKLQIPVLGRVFRLSLFSQFARTLGTLLQNGVPVLTALRITEKVVSNTLVREAIARTREEVTDGKTIAQPLAKSGVFPQLMIDLIRIGEETGDVPGALRNVAETYENELTVALRVMTNLIEPAIIIVLAVVVGFLLLSVLSAMFAITSNIAR